VEVHDVGRLSHRAARSILDRVLSGGGAEPDNLDLLKAMRARLEAAGLSPPTITVRFRDLSVRATITVAHHALPSISGPLRGRLASAAHRRRHLLVDDASGVLRPGAFTLLLGPPQSGKTTLLRALAGLDRRTPGLKTSAGELTYNGLGLGEFVPERSAAYISQQDLHFGELTVRETLEFSARCQSTGHRRAVLEELEARESAAGVEPDPALAAYMRGAAMGGRRSLMVELVLRLLGLDGSADTVVGSAMLRGISGGQRKRVTTGEVVVGPARVLLADEISTGLDSSTTFAIMRALQNLSHVMHATMLVGLLQPAPEVFELFDDVMVLAVGKVVFHGPREAVVAHFSDLGLVVPQRCGVADFLQEVTTPSDQHVSAQTRPRLLNECWAAPCVCGHLRPGAPRRNTGTRRARASPTATSRPAPCGTPSAPPTSGAPPPPSWTAPSRAPRRPGERWPPSSTAPRPASSSAPWPPAPGSCCGAAGRSPSSGPRKSR
jgi:ABC-type multidrug transport system ATPase subunit